MFPYTTGYSSKMHIGCYVMSEKGDTVQIIFIKKDENQAYAVQSVRKEDTDKTTDPEVKYLCTPNGKEIKPGKEEILITAKDDVTYIKINEASGVEIITDKAVQVTSLQQNQAMNSRLLQTRSLKQSQNRHWKSSVKTMK